MAKAKCARESGKGNSSVRTGADITRALLTTSDRDDEGQRLESAIHLLDDALNGGDPNCVDRQCRLMLEYQVLRYGRRAKLPSEYRSIVEIACDTIRFIAFLANSNRWPTVAEHLTRFSWRPNTMTRADVSALPRRLFELKELDDR